MTFERASAGATTAPAVPRAIRLLRFAGTAILSLLALACAVLLVVRFIAFPQVERNRDTIAQALAMRIGQPVTIDQIMTGWDGWNPKLSIRGFKVGEPAHPVLDLPRVDFVIAWISLPLLDVRLKELVLDGPQLAVRRDTAGRIHIAGIEIDPDAPPDDSGLTDWLLRQHDIVVQNALVTWTDDLRKAPQLILDHVQFRLEQGFGRHRFGLTGVPPAELAAPIDLRGEFSDATLKNWQDARGLIYVRLDYADVAAWRDWLPLPVAIESGKGAVRVWFEFAAGQPREVTADLELLDVRARLGGDLPALELAHLSGRAGGHREGVHLEIYTKALAFTTRSGATLPPMNLSFDHDDAHENHPARGALRFDHLDLGPLTAVAAELPLPVDMRLQIARFAPQGILDDGKVEWEGPAGSPQAYRTSARFHGFGMTAQDLFPGTTGMSGSIEATEAKGSLKLDSRSTTLTLPHAFADPLAFDVAKASVDWQKSGGEWQVRIDGVNLTNAHLAATAAGVWRYRGEGPGELELKAQVTHFTAENLYRYLPVKLNSNLRAWLRHALPKGSTRDARLTVNGNLAHFPFVDGQGGQLSLAVKAQDVTLDYADGWPPITDMEGEFHLEGSRMTVEASTGHVFGAHIGHAHAEFADLADPQHMLRVDGDVSGPTADFLTFIARSPVTEWIGHGTDDIQATGNGRLALNFSLPLRDPGKIAISGEYQLSDNQLRIVGAPPLFGLNGTIMFSEKEMHARDLAGETFGGPFKLQLASAEGRVQVSAAGRANLALLRNEFDWPLLDRVSGTTDWTLAMQPRGATTAWTLESTLAGAVVDLPAPVGKRAEEVAQIRIERRHPAAGEDQVTLDYAQTVRVLVHRRINAAGANVDRGLVLLGRATERDTQPTQAGIWLRGDVANFNADAWLAVYRATEARRDANAGRAGDSPAFEGIDLQAGTLQALGRNFKDIKLGGRHVGEDWRINLDGADLAGTAVWRTPSPAQPNGRMTARLARISVPPSADSPQDAASLRAPSPIAANTWPAIDLTAEAFQSKGRTLGRLELTAAPKDTDWQITTLVLANEAGRISGEGWWRTARPQQTRLDFTLDVSDAAGFLARFNMPDTVRGAATKINGQLDWTGAPSDFDYPTLNGTLHIDTGPGQFTKADPGVGRLLGVLSLQSLPRRITLDFRDVFSEGFAFDSFVGDVRIQNGVMRTDDLHMVGPAAAVSISGEADLARETQQLRVRVQPSLTTSVSAGAAVLFLANPLIGAAVGAGALLAQKILNNPIDKMFSYDYLVSGGWDDPVVQRAAGRTTASTGEVITR